jgi:predicted Rossmann-fold nucleotide-binding protein
MTLNKINAIHKPMALFDINGFYQKLDGLMDTFVEYGYLDEEVKGLLIMNSDAEKLVEALEDYK